MIFMPTGFEQARAVASLPEWTGPKLPKLLVCHEVGLLKQFESMNTGSEVHKAPRANMVGISGRTTTAWFSTVLIRPWLVTSLPTWTFRSAFLVRSEAIGLASPAGSRNCSVLAS